MKTNLTFDDVQIVPRYSELKSRQDVDLNTKFTKKTTLHRTPIVAAPMDTICEYEMANQLLDQGSVGVLHRFRSIEKQAKDMKRLWNKWDSWYNIGNPKKDRTELIITNIGFNSKINRKNLDQKLILEIEPESELLRRM